MKPTTPARPLDSSEDSKILCEDCEDPIPLARIKIVATKLCVACQEALERELAERGEEGTLRHRMAFEVIGTEDVEAVHLHLIRAK